MFKIRFFIKLFIIFVIPFLLTLWLFSPLEKKERDCVSEKECYISLKDKPSFRQLIADALQIPLNLKWYRIYIDYSTIEEELKTYCGNDFRLDSFEIELSEDLPQRYGQSNLIKDENNNRFYQIPQGKKGIFIASDSDNIYTKAMYGFSNCDYFMKQECNIPSSYNVYIKPYIWSWFAKLVLVYILWLYLCAAIITIFKIR